MNAHEFSLEKLQVLNSTLDDLDAVFSFFDAAIDYQKKNNYELWPQFSRELIENEIAEKRHWKVMDGNEVVCIFSVMYNDPVIWGERDRDPSVYLHRIAVNPLCKGKRSMSLIKDWALQHAREKQLKYVRMDTWGNNETLKEYYVTCGFNYSGKQHLKNTEGLPSHYGGSFLSLFQINA